MSIELVGTDDAVADVAGYEFGVRDAEKLLGDSEALWVLQNLHKKGCVIIQLDDGPHPGIDLLKELTGAYWDAFEVRCGRQLVFIEHDRFDLDISGV